MADTRRKIKQDQLLLIAGDGLSLNGQDRLQLGDNESIFFTPTSLLELDGYLKFNGIFESENTLDNKYVSSYFGMRGITDVPTYNLYAEDDEHYVGLLGRVRGFSSTISNLNMSAGYQGSSTFAGVDVRVTGANRATSKFEVFNENFDELKLEFRSDQGGTIRDEIFSKGISYHSDYSTNGVLDDRWIPDFGAVNAVTEGKFVRYDINNQGLTTTQQENARTNVNSLIKEAGIGLSLDGSDRLQLGVDLFNRSALELDNLIGRGFLIDSINTDSQGIYFEKNIIQSTNGRRYNSQDLIYTGYLSYPSVGHFSFYDTNTSSSDFNTIRTEYGLNKAFNENLVFEFFGDLTTEEFSAKFIDSVNSKGIEYDGDYEGNFTARSLITKQYVDGLTDDLENNKVSISGDTMTGSLLITAPARLDSVTTGGTDVLNIGTQNAGVINIGWEGAVINFEGTQHNMEGTNTYFTDKLVTYNVGGPIASAVSTGFEIEEDAVITGYFKTNGTRDGWLLKAPANEELELDTAGITTSRNQSFQDFSGTIALVGAGLTDSRYATTSHAATHISGGSDQIDGEDLKVEVVPPTTNYAPTESTLRGHFQGIDSTLGTLRTTTAGLLARVFFTGEEHVVNSVTYFRSKLGDFGSVANASPTPLSLTQASGETFFNQDLLSDPFAADLFVPAGAFSGTLTVRVNSAGHQERYRVEIYLADGTTGAVVDSGVSGAPVGDLGVPVIAAFSTGVIELPNGVLTNASIDGTLLESINIPTGARVRTHISAQKLTSGGGSMTFEVFYGSDNRSQYDIPVAPTTDTVINRSDVTGQTSGEALDFLLNNKENLSNKATNFTTLNNTLYPTTQAVVNKFVTLDTIQSISSIKTFGANTLRIESSGGGANQELRFRNITATSAGNTGVTTMGINGNNDLFIHKGSTGNEGILAFNNTSLRTYTLQDKSGTVAHLDDITSAVNGTNNTIPKFTGANTIGDSQITDDGTTLGLTTNWSILSSGILQSNGAQTIQTSGTEALTLQGNGGNVGIGASAIGQTAGLGTTLTVKGTIPGIEIIGNRASNGIVSTIPFLNDSSTDTTFQKRIVQISAFRDISNERGVLTFQNHNGTSLLETARITSNGNFLIGTTTDTGEKLQVNGNLKASGSKVNFANLPTSDPAVAGDLWNDSGTVKISAG